MEEQNKDIATETKRGARISLPTDAMTRTKSASGSVSYHCGDAVARALNGLNLAFVKVLASEALDIDTSKYDHLNPGQQRMTIGNVMRNMLRRDESLIDKFNEVLEKVQKQHDEATAEERERAEAEKQAKQQLKDQKRLDKEQAKADRERERQEKMQKREADKQAKADERAKKNQEREEEKARKQKERDDKKAEKEAEKQRKAQAKADAKKQKELDLAEASTGESAE